MAYVRILLTDGSFLRQTLVAVMVTIALVTPASGEAAEASAPAVSFAQMGEVAASTLVTVFYRGKGVWWLDAAAAGGTGRNSSHDWGADSMIYAAWLRWTTVQDARVPKIMAEMQQSSVDYAKGSMRWSDVPMWDSIADSREFDVLKTVRPALAAKALEKAKSAFAYVDADTQHCQFARGAAPTIDFQTAKRPHYKTLETDGNYIKAAILLYDETGDPQYLARAERKYAAVRTYFLDPTVPLYTLEGSDDGTTWSPHPRLFFSSINGIMLWNSYRLGLLTKKSAYTQDAVASLHAIVDHLADATGIFESLEAEWDTHEPMVEAMWMLAKSGDAAVAPIASRWITANATAAASSVADDGLRDRFFGGIAPLVTHPPAGQPARVTAWQEAGGFALAMAAADLAGRTTAATDYWRGATYHALDLAVGEAPQSITCTARAITLIGPLEAGRRHVLVSIDGVPLESQMGIFPTCEQRCPNAVLFAWRWPTGGSHTILLTPDVAKKNAKTKPLQLDGYYTVP